jgi:tRNA uracil 4-sulfurtransferase
VEVALVSPAGEIQTKSRPTRRRFRAALRANLHVALLSRQVEAEVLDAGGRLALVGDPDAAARAAADVFGVHHVDITHEVAADSLDRLVDAVAARAGDRVRGRTFAVRVRRRGTQAWRRPEAERRIGTALYAHSAGVDLERPDVTVKVLAYDDAAFLVERTVDGPGGLPLGTQDPALVLLSGGFDSAAAAWYVLRRGVPVHFVHAELACAQTDHAIAVAHELTRRWAPGTDPVMWVLDFEPVRRTLRAEVAPRVRQVRLKELMLRAADAVAERAGIEALVTGEALGQVSTQTLRHLAVVDRAASRPVLRPLTGFDKDEIVALSRRIGTHDLSVRAQEVCDLADGRPVATRAGDRELTPARAAAPDALALDAAERAWRLPLAEWVPGLPAPWAA